MTLMEKRLNNDLSETIHSTTGSASAIQLTYLFAILYSVFVVYGSLVPLHFVPRPFNEAIIAFQNIPFLNLGIDSRADWVANLLLFIPLSFLYNQIATFNKTGATKHLVSFSIFAITVALAVSIEFTQLFFPQRTVSQNDIWAESLGSVIGIACQYLWGRKFQTWLEKLWRLESRKSRLMKTLNVYLLILLVFNVLPLDLTISPIELYHKWAGGRVVLLPFGGLKGSFSERLYETLTDLLIWVPVGFLWSLERKHQIARVAILGMLAASVIEFAQLFVYSRVTDVTDILLAGVGAAMGALAARQSQRTITRFDTPNAALWFSLWILWAMIILAVFWFPYDFDISRVTVTRAQAAFFRPVLENFYFGSEFHATNELLRKLGFFLPGGTLLGLAIHRSASNKRTSYVKSGLALFLLALLVEIGQLGLPQKFADLTDVLIQTAGGLFGLLVTRWVLSGHESAIKQFPVDRSEPPRQDTQRKAISLAHSLRWNPHLVTFAGLFVVIGTITNLPFVPYNVRELIEPGIYGVFSIIGLCLTIQWSVNGHFIFLERCNRNSGQMIYLPLWLLIHGFLSWIFIRLTVPLECIHDIVGSPVLGWFWEWELIGRYLALHGAIALQIIGATILISIAHKRSQIEIFLTWMIWSMLLAWPLHRIVVEQAATDNLTELMRNGGTFISSTLLAVGWFSIVFSGSAISSLFATRSYHFSIVVLSALAVFSAALCFWFGSEQVIMKYDKIFSAWQFLLSSDRQHYTNGPRLYLRFIAALALLLGCWSLIQMPFWKTAAGGKRHHEM